LSAYKQTPRLAWIIALCWISLCPIAIGHADDAPAEPPAEPVEVSEETPAPEAPTAAVTAPPVVKLSPLEVWMRDSVLEATITGGVIWGETRGRVPLLRQDGEPAIGLGLDHVDLAWYLGGGQDVALDAWQPGDSDTATSLTLRDYALGQFDANWWTIEYHQGPALPESRFLHAEQRFRFTGEEAIDVEVTRTHVADAGLRTPGPVDGESETWALKIPMRLPEHNLAGTVTASTSQYTDRSTRFANGGAKQLGGTVTYDLADTQHLALGGAIRIADTQATAAEQRTSALAMTYVDAALAGDPAWRWEVRGDWQQTDETIQKSWIPNKDWSAGTVLTWNDSPWRVSAGWKTSERERYRLSPEAFQELLIDPQRESFERGVYLSDTPHQEQIDLALRYQPDRQWRVTLDYRRQQMDGLPETGLGTADPADLDPSETLWFSEQERLRGTVRYQVAPLVQVVASAWQVDRGLSGRGSGSSYGRWDITWQDASHPTSWYLRTGEVQQSATRDRVDVYTNSAWLAGGGVSMPLGSDDDWQLDIDGTLLEATGRGAFDEWQGAISLEHEMDDRWSVLGSWSFTVIDLEDPNSHVDAIDQQFGLLFRWKR